MLNIFPIIAIILSVAIILVIFIRHYHDILIIDIEKIPEERAKKKKDQIIAERLDRRTKAFFLFFSRKTQPFLRLLRGLFFRAYKKVLAYEHYIRTERGENDFSLQKKETLTSTEHKIQGDNFVREENYSAAEKSYLEAIRLDPKNLDTYRVLAVLYKEKRDSDLARETWKYVLEHEPADIQALLALYNIDHETGKEEEAILYLKKALACEPLHPKLLDAMVESCIIINDKRTAEAVLLRLAEVNPENAKLKEFRERIHEMPT